MGVAPAGPENRGGMAVGQHLGAISLPRSFKMALPTDRARKDKERRQQSANDRGYFSPNAGRPSSR